MKQRHNSHFCWDSFDFLMLASRIQLGFSFRLKLTSCSRLTKAVDVLKLENCLGFCQIEWWDKFYRPDSFNNSWSKIHGSFWVTKCSWFLGIGVSSIRIKVYYFFSSRRRHTRFSEDIFLNTFFYFTVVIFWDSVEATFSSWVLSRVANLFYTTLSESLQPWIRTF